MKRITLFLLIALVAVSSAEAQKVKRTKQKEEDGFVWYLLSQEYNKGAEIEKGNIIIPVKYGSVQYLGHRFFSATEYNDNEKKWQITVYNRNGTIIIPPVKDYQEVTYIKTASFFEVKNNGKLGLCDTNGRIILPCKFSHIVTHNNRIKAYTSYSTNNSSWNTLGYYDINGKEIISPEKGYNDIQAVLGGYVVYKGGAHNDRKKYIITAGYCDDNGNEIVSPDRGYSDIEAHCATDDKTHKIRYLQVCKDGGKYDQGVKKGVCDLKGDEIIRPMDCGLWVTGSPTDISYNDQNGFYYEDPQKTKHYLGFKLNSKNQIIPDPDHPLGTTDKYVSNEHQQEQTAYNNSNSSSYNNTYTPPAQHKQQNTGDKSNNKSSTQPKSSSSSSSSASSSNKPSSSSNRPSHNSTTASSFQQQKVKCGQCRGTGMTNCWSCGGKGTIRKSGIDKNGKQVFRNDRCTGCNGSGKRKCTVCNGKGVR